MQYERGRDFYNSSVLYNEHNDPTLYIDTVPIPRYQLPHESWFQRLMHAIGNFIAAVVRKINQILGFALAVLLLLLFAHFILTFFGLTGSLFSRWFFILTAPLLMPFNNFLPIFPYRGLIVDLSTLAAMVVYLLAVTIVRLFLKVLIARV
jgi:YGGT family